MTPPSTFPERLHGTEPAHFDFVVFTLVLVFVVGLLLVLAAAERYSDKEA